MPELPEVETIRRSLEKKVIGKSIEKVEALLSQIVKQPAYEDFAAGVKGEIIENLGRRGKYLLFHFKSGKTLVVHLRMTGQLIYCPPNEPREKHLCLIFTLENQETREESNLRYLDIRRFGCFYLLNPGERLPGIEKLGPEPLENEFTLDYLKRALQGKKGKIKALLLDQEVIAGLGNIYVDECLFRAGIRPERTGNSLNLKEIERLHQAIPEVLKESISRRGTTISDYLDSEGKKGTFQNYLQVYGRGGEECVNCGSVIQRIKLGGRSTCFCPQCQN